MQTRRWLDPKQVPIAESAAEFFTQKICWKNLDIQIMCQKQHCNKAVWCAI